MTLLFPDFKNKPQPSELSSWVSRAWHLRWFVKPGTRAIGEWTSAAPSLLRKRDPSECSMSQLAQEGLSPAHLISRAVLALDGRGDTHGDESSASPRARCCWLAANLKLNKVGGKRRQKKADFPTGNWVVGDLFFIGKKSPEYNAAAKKKKNEWPFSCVTAGFRSRYKRPRCSVCLTCL